MKREETSWSAESALVISKKNRIALHWSSNASILPAKLNGTAKIRSDKPKELKSNVKRPD